MTAHLSTLLLLTGLAGIHSITTISKLSVRKEESISIPCLYGLRYQNHVKYLCKGYEWHSCSYAVKTNQPQSSGKFSISDDKHQKIFTVTIRNLTHSDTDFWCIVEINNGGDKGVYFHLSVTGGMPRLYVKDQELTGFNGETLTINCHYSNSGPMKWCKLGGSCVTGSSGSIDGTNVTINSSFHHVFNVTMSGLKPESSGWYWCAKGDVQMPVHITVIERPTAIIPTTVKTVTTVIGDSVVTTVKNGSLSSSVDLKGLIIALSLLILIVIVGLFFWLILRHKKTKTEAPATTKAEDEVTYSSVVYVNQNSAQRSYDEREVDVVYSSVVTKKEQSVKQGETIEMDVTYSTVAHHQNI